MKTIFLSQFIFLFIFSPLIGSAQYINISGYITSYISGNAIENATIFEKMSGIGTISDENGFFQLTLLPGNVNIMFDEDGYDPLLKEFTVQKDTVLMVQLKPSKWLKNKEKEELQTKNKQKLKESNSRRKFLFF